MEQQGILKGKNNNFIYAYMGGETFLNVTTGVSKYIPLKDAKSLFVIPITLNKMVEKNPTIIDLVERLGLKLEDYTEEEKKEFLKNNE